MMIPRTPVGLFLAGAVIALAINAFSNWPSAAGKGGRK